LPLAFCFASLSSLSLNFASFVVQSEDFDSLGEWQNFTFYFELKALEQLVEFVSIHAKEGVNIYLDHVLLEQVSI